MKHLTDDGTSVARPSSPPPAAPLPQVPPPGPVAPAGGGDPLDLLIAEAGQAAVTGESEGEGEG